jgi:hypothetical protein
MVEELWIFKEIADMAASEWCHVAQGTPSINAYHSGCNLGAAKQSLTSRTHKSASLGYFRWKSKMAAHVL